MAQNRIGLEAGWGTCTFSNISANTATHVDVTFNADAYYMRKASRHIYWGVRLGVEQYSFDIDKKRYDGLGGYYGTSISNKSTYMSLGPMVDLGIGKYRHYLHAYTYASVGFALSRDQVTRDYYVTPQINNAYDNARFSDVDVNGVIFRMGFGFRENLPVSKTWQITLHQSYSFMPFGDISSAKGAGGTTQSMGINSHPGFVSVGVGAVHKFKDARKMRKED